MTSDHRSFKTSAIALAMLLCVVGCQPDRPVAVKSSSLKLVPVKTVAVETAAVQRTTQQPASIHAFYRAKINAKVNGYVKEVKAEIGDFVEADAELAIIDVPEMKKQREALNARIKRHLAEEKRAAAGVTLAAAKMKSASALVDESKSMMSQADASFAASQAQFDRTQDLVGRGSLQNRMLDEARKLRDSELASIQATKSSIESATAGVTVAEAQKASAEADLEAAKSETEIIRKQLEELDAMIAYATIRAPFAGIVTERTLEPGDLTKDHADGKPLFVISKVDVVRVRIPIPETDAVYVTLGDKVALTFPSFSDEPTIEATVARRSGSLDPSTRTMMVEVDLPNPEGKFLPGMFGHATIDLSNKSANMLPAQAIRFKDGSSPYVYVVDENDKVTVAKITTGIDTGNKIEVLSGLETGQRVVGSNLKRFTTGQKVRVLPN